MPLFTRINLLCFILLVFGSKFVIADNSFSKKPWIGFSSGLTVSGQYYRKWGGDPRQQPFMYSISGAPALDIKGMTMPFNVLYSNQLFTVQQPFNMIGIAPRFKWGTFYLGSSAMKFSNYSLSGQRFTGVGADLQLGWIRLGGDITARDYLLDSDRMASQVILANVPCHVNKYFPA